MGWGCSDKSGDGSWEGRRRSLRARGAGLGDPASAIKPPVLQRLKPAWRDGGFVKGCCAGCGAPILAMPGDTDERCGRCTTRPTPTHVVA